MLSLILVYHAETVDLNAKNMEMELMLMQLGVSTANLYPMKTEDALDTLLSLGIQRFEVFLNTESEAESRFAQELRHRAEHGGAVIRSVHPYTSGYEPYMLFSEYVRRFEDALGHYERVFAAAAEMGASYVIMHGDRVNGILSVEQSAQRYERVYDLGRSHGVTLLQENVVRFRASDLSYITGLRSLLGEKANFVFDLKQCIRCGARPEEVINGMGKGLRHAHISDYIFNNPDATCLLPGKGEANYPALAAAMRKVGFDEDWIIELYRKNFDTPRQLADAVKQLEEMLDL